MGRKDHNIDRVSWVTYMIKNLLSMWEAWVRPLDWEDPLEKGMVNYSSILAWRIPWTEEPGGLSPEGHKVSDTTEQFHSLSLIDREKNRVFLVN